MKDQQCVHFLQWVLPQLGMRWPGFRKVRRQVCKRIDRRLRELDLPDAAAYRDWIESHPDELQVLDEFCRITISRFYRDRGVFDFLTETLLPELAAAAQAQARSELRCWSAGCASGEEPYTLKIVWEQALARQAPGLSLKIIATDSDPHMLQRARRGCYPRSSLKDLPRRWLETCYDRFNDEYCIRPEYRPGIHWLQHDIRREMPAGPFDLIFCRHLAFTYFDEPLQRDILNRLAGRLRPGGALVTGKQEKLPPLPSELVADPPKLGVYRRRDHAGS